MSPEAVLYVLGVWLLMSVVAAVTFVVVMSRRVPK